MKKRPFRMKIMRINHRLLPVRCIPLPGVVIVRPGTPRIAVQHGKIHAAQQFELLAAGFAAALPGIVFTPLAPIWLVAGLFAVPLAYAVETLAVLFRRGALPRYTRFEAEALRHEADPFYFGRRRLFAWLRPAPPCRGRNMRR